MSDSCPPEALRPDRLASALRERGLAAPALLLIELLRPWRFFASQLLLLSEPMWASSRRPQVRRYAAWMETPGQIEALQDELERPRGSEAAAR